MEFSTFYAGKNDDGRRLDKIVRKFLPENNLSNLYKSIRNGFIKVNDKKAKQDTRINDGDKISIADVLLNKLESSDTTNAVETFDINQFPAFSEKNTIFKNEYVLIINKPYDVNVQGENSLAKQISEIYKHSSQKNSLSFNPGPLHRLDRKTTGVLVFSQNLEGAKWFSNEFASHSLKKTYLTILQGHLEEKEEWIDFIAKENEDSSDKFHTVKVLTKESDNNSKKAITTAEPLSYGQYQNTLVTLAKIEITTGRTHQIRSQASFHGHPLLGDTAYGGIKICEEQDFYLHAYSLELQKNNPLQVPQKVCAFISTNFEKMLNKTLIKFDSINII